MVLALLDGTMTLISCHNPWWRMHQQTLSPRNYIYILLIYFVNYVLKCNCCLEMSGMGMSDTGDWECILWVVWALWLRLVPRVSWFSVKTFNQDYEPSLASIKCCWVHEHNLLNLYDLVHTWTKYFSLQTLSNTAKTFFLCWLKRKRSIITFLSKRATCFTTPNMPSNLSLRGNIRH